MLITRTSIVSGIRRSRELDVTPEQILAWQQGMPIQDAMPQLNADEREFVMTGITSEEWNQLFEEKHTKSLNELEGQ